MAPALIDLNCDLGESFGVYRIGEDEAVLGRITSANVACGFHAGDPRVMLRTVRLAKAAGVAVGAHPGFPDLVGFGRRDLLATPDEVYTDTLYQIGALGAICRAQGVALQHVKPHGQLNNLAYRDRAMAEALAAAVRDAAEDLVLVAYGGELALAAQSLGVPLAREAFADRAYRPDGSLVPRSEPGAVLHDPAAAARRAAGMVADGGLRAADGSWLELRPDTICVHGDTPGAAALAGALREALAAAGIAVRGLREVLAARADRTQP